MIKNFKKSPTEVDVLVVIVGHKFPDFLHDTAESFDHYNKNSKTSYRIAFAIDFNRDTADYLAAIYGPECVYRSASQNGWGRGIYRTLAYALDHYKRNGLRWKHLITIDSDTLIVGPCLDEYVSKVSDGVCFVGQKWGGKGQYSSSNPGPNEHNQRQVRHLAKLGIFNETDWRLVDYMVAGPFMLWTKLAQDILTDIGLLPGPELDEIYQFFLFPHDQVSTLILGLPDCTFVPVGRSSMLHCGDMGGDDTWKAGLPSIRIPPYGQVPKVPGSAAVIHPIRSKKFQEGNVRSYFKKLRGQ
jgi:hypothetical protein